MLDAILPQCDNKRIGTGFQSICAYEPVRS